MIINFIGLCGSGKTTLAKKLSKHYKLPILTIGEFRKQVKIFYLTKNKFKELYVSDEDEFYHHIEHLAWIKMFTSAAKLMFRNYIICTSGLNGRLDFLLRASHDVINVKLICPLKILKQRLAKRHIAPQPWFYGSIGYEGFNEHIKQSLKDRRAEITIDTGKYDREQVYKLAVKKINEREKWEK